MAALDEDKALKMMKKIKKRAEAVGINPSLLNGWNAHITGVNEVPLLFISSCIRFSCFNSIFCFYLAPLSIQAGQLKGHYTDPSGTQYRFHNLFF
jgi:hypothetical protein